MTLKDYGEKWIEAGGVRTRYFDAGRGANPIVFIHGGQMGDASGGENAEDWEPNFRAMASFERVIAFDRLGQGYTGNPDLDCDCTMAGAVRHAIAFLGALGAGPYHLVGHSRGGYVAAAVSLAEPGLVSSCVIVDSASAAPGEGRNSIVFASNPYAPGTLDSARFIYENYSFDLEHVTNDWLEEKQKIAELPKTKDMISRMSTLLAARFLPEFVEDRDRFFTQIASDGFRRPVLLVWGYDDLTAPLQMGLDLFDLIAKHQARTLLSVVNKAGHFSFRERPAAFNRAVSGFVKGVRHGD